MKIINTKKNLRLVCASLIVGMVLMATMPALAYKPKAEDIRMDTTNFDGALSSDDDTAQKVADKLDDVSGAAGQANTASNTGSAGTGVFKAKVGVDLQLYKLNSTTDDLTIGLDGTDKIDFTFNPGNVDISEIGGIGTAGKNLGYIFVADGTEFNSVEVSGDITIGSSGVVTIQDGAISLIEVADIGSSTNIAGYLLIADGTNWQSIEITGDINLGSDGIMNIQNNVVDGTMIQIDSETIQSIMFWDGDVWTTLSAGTAGLFLETQDVGSPPVWSAVSLSSLSGIGVSTPTLRNMFVADGTDFNSVSISGDITIGVDGEVTVAGDSHPHSVSTVTMSIGDMTDVGNSTLNGGYIFIADGTNFNSHQISGDITVGSTGIATIQSNSVDGTNIALGGDQQGDIMYYDGTDWVRLPKGTNGQFLKIGASIPAWATTAGGVTSLSDLSDVGTTVPTSGYMLIADGTNFISRVISGDITINSTGVTTVGSNKVKDSMIDWGLGAGQVSAADVPIALGINSPTVDQIQEYLDNTGSSGFFLGGAVSDGGSGTVDVAAGSGFIRTTNDDNAELQSFKWSASAGIAVTDDTTQYIYVDDSGVISLSTNEFLETADKIKIGVVTDEAASIIHTFNLGVRLQESVAEAGRFIRRVHGVSRDKRRGGLLFGQSSDANRDVTMTAGSLWWGRTEYVIGAFDTSGVDTFATYSASGSENAVASQWPNAQYDNAGTLTTMTNNRWANLFFFLEPDDNIVMIYGRGQFVSEALADAEDVPSSSLPSRVSETSILAARFTFQKSANTATVASAFEQLFANASVTDHGNLAGLTDDDHTQYVLADGTRALSSNWDAGAFTITALSFASDVVTGTAPIVVASVTEVTNLRSATATALAANPSDCAANQFANTIAASGNLTCAAIADADVPNTITIDLATTVTTNANLTGDVTSVGNATTISSNAVDGSMIAMGADATGDIIYYNGTDYVRLAKGTNGQFLKIGATIPAWATSAGGVTSLSDLSDVGTTVPTSGYMLIADGTNFNSVVISGDMTINSSGIATVADDSHNHVITNIDVFTKANLETQTSDVADFAEADGDTYSGVHDFGGVTSLEIPNGTAPTVDTTGEVAIDITDGSIISYYNGAATVFAHPVLQSTFTVSDDGDWDGEVVPIWVAPKDMAVTIVEVHAAVIGQGSPALTYNIEERAKGLLGSSGTDLYTVDISADADGTTTTSFANSVMSASAHLVFTTASTVTISGTVDLIQGVIYYQKNIE